MTNKSKTIRFRCADCQTYIGMHPEGFPILALNPGLSVDGNIGPSQKFYGTAEHPLPDYYLQRNRRVAQLHGSGLDAHCR